jgi:mannose-6-phosphate isomerase-like protein (cupin superfamily)
VSNELNRNTNHPFRKEKAMMSAQESLPPSTRPLAVSIPANRPNYVIGSDTYSFVLTGKETAGAYAFIDMLIPPGGGPIPHAHEFEEMFYVIEGEIEVFCRDARTTAVPGTAINIPSWAPHVFKNVSPVVPARMFCVVVKAGLEEQFAEIGTRVATRTTPPPPVDPAKKEEMMKKLPAIVARYHAKILPPDTFNHLMTEGELKIINAANGE